jgi:hypothetical protein
MNIKIKFPIKFQVDVSFFNDDLEIPIYIKYGEKEIRIPEEFHDVGKNIKINFTTENENIVTTTGKTENERHTINSDT